MVTAQGQGLAASLDTVPVACCVPLLQCTGNFQSHVAMCRRFPHTHTHSHPRERTELGKEVGMGEGGGEGGGGRKEGRRNSQKHTVSANKAGGITSPPTYPPGGG